MRGTHVLLWLTLPITGKYIRYPGRQRVKVSMKCVFYTDMGSNKNPSQRSNVSYVKISADAETDTQTLPYVLPRFCAVC